MANYGIQFNNAGKALSSLWNSGSGVFTVRVRFQTGALSQVDGIIGTADLASPTTSIALFTDGKYAVRMGAANVYVSPTSLLTTSTDYEIEVKRTAGTSCSTTLFAANGTTVLHTNTFTSSEDFRLYSYGGVGDPLLAFDGIIWWCDATGGAGDRTYENVVAGTGATWTDTTSSEDATLSGLPTDGSQWVLEGGNSIAVADPPYINKVYQRDTETTSSSSFAVTYAGAPAALQYRLLDAADDSTEIITWTTFDASPSGGTSTLTFNAPTSTTSYHVEVRHSDNVGIADLQTVDWSAGIIVWVIGQSLAEELAGDGAITAASGYVKFDGTNGVVPTTGAGTNAMANALIGAAACSVMIVDTATSATALTVEAGDALYWNDPTGSLWTNATAKITAATVNDKMEFVWWHQGTRDSLASVTKSVYQAAMGAFFTRMRATYTARDSGTLQVLGASLNRDTRGVAVDADRQVTRSAQLDYAASDSAYTTLNTYYIATSDGVHGTDAAYAQLGSEIVATYFAVKGDISVNAPAPTVAVLGVTADKIDITYDSTLLSSDSSYSTEGVRVTLDGTPLTVTAFDRKSATVATITVSASIGSGSVAVFVSYGIGATATALVYPRSVNAVLPSSGGTFNIPSIPVDGLLVTVSSTLNITATSTPDGTYKTIITNPSDDSIVFAGNLAYSSGAATTGSLSLAVSTALTGFVIDNEATHLNGAVITGTTV
jgi:hypothetical protein